MSLHKRGEFWHYAFTVKGRRFRGSTEETNKYLAGLVEANEFKKARENGVNALTGASPTLEAYAAGFTKWIEETHSVEPKTKKCYHNGWGLLKATKLLQNETGRDHQSGMSGRLVPWWSVERQPGSPNPAPDVEHG